MILTELRDYIQLRQTTSLTELMQRFHKTADDLLPLLDVWVQKGRVQCVASPQCGGACANCPLRCTAYYCYVTE